MDQRLGEAELAKGMGWSELIVGITRRAMNDVGDDGKGKVIDRERRRRDCHEVRIRAVFGEPGQHETGEGIGQGGLMGDVLAAQNTLPIFTAISAAG